MNQAWPDPRLDGFLRALPFEHLLRKRPFEQALTRWRQERVAYAAARAGRVVLLLDCGERLGPAIQTAATWGLQTWPGVQLLAKGACAAGVCDWAARHGLALAREDVIEGVDWVVPAQAGDLLHPSLAGIVAIEGDRGADAVAWDWLRIERVQDMVQVQARHRAPWRDDAGELQCDRRGRAFALRAQDWFRHPAKTHWERRMRAPARDRRIHPEPLGLYPRFPDAAVADAGIAEAAWGAPFEIEQGRLQPTRAADGISVVLLYRDRVEFTLRALKSLLAQRYAGKLQLLLVDNQSSQATRDAITAALDAMPPRVDVTVIDYDAAFNHSRQCNFAVSQACEEVLLILNNDVELLDPGALDALARWALLPRVASAGLCMVDARGQPVGGGLQCRREPGAEFNSPVEEAAGEVAARMRMVVGNTFACAALRRETFDAMGGLDELAFPVAYNDVDFCLRATAQGWVHVNLGHCRATHAVGASRARCDEIAQKLMLRRAHPWAQVQALAEVAEEVVALPGVCLPPSE